MDDAAGDRTETTPSLEAARKAWVQAYMALKLLVEAALRLAGKPVNQVDAEAQAGETPPEAVPAP